MRDVNVAAYEIAAIETVLAGVTRDTSDTGDENAPADHPSSNFLSLTFGKTAEGSFSRSLFYLFIFFSLLKHKFVTRNTRNRSEKPLGISARTPGT